MDEPTAGLALRERAALMELTDTIASTRGIGVLFTEHDMDVVFGHASRILVLLRGEIIAAGSPQEIRDTLRPHAAILVAPPHSGLDNRQRIARPEIGVPLEELLLLPQQPVQFGPVVHCAQPAEEYEVLRWRDG